MGCSCLQRVGWADDEKRDVCCTSTLLFNLLNRLSKDRVAMLRDEGGGFFEGAWDQSSQEKLGIDCGILKYLVLGAGNKRLLR